LELFETDTAIINNIHINTETL